ncbi:MAG TPA: terminase family protein [Xanthomonadaceae bacterium]|nr:terminase family protein [Xanthomonadaceae bacterium]
MSETYFLPYQAAWIKDRARFKIAAKSRRVGLTYAQSYEDVLDASRADGAMDVWFSSADASAAKEYIRYCAQWAKILKIAAQELGEVVIEKDGDVRALVIEFATGKRIYGLSSNPKAFRSKGGKLVLDEFAFHADQDELWKAARPIITWGYPVRVISTYNGKGNRYYRMVSDVQKALAAGKSSTWNLHTITIIDAVAQGLADRILSRKLTDAERQVWLDEVRETCGDEDTWRQEYLCEPIDEASAWLPWDLIVSCESEEAGKPELYQGGDCYLGGDIARRKDATVFWVIERVGDVYITREVVRLRRKSFAEQDAAFDRLFAAYNIRRVCMDQTGMGEKVVEDAQTRHGTYRVEGVQFTAAVKHHLAVVGKQCFEDKRVRIPIEREIREAHHAVRKLTTIAGNPRYDAQRTEAGHADEFWAHMLALHAAEGTAQPAAGDTVEATADDLLPAGMIGRRRARMWGNRPDRLYGRRSDDLAEALP